MMENEETEDGQQCEEDACKGIDNCDNLCTDKNSPDMYATDMRKAEDTNSDSSQSTRLAERGVSAFTTPAATPGIGARKSRSQSIVPSLINRRLSRVLFGGEGAQKRPSQVPQVAPVYEPKSDPKSRSLLQLAASGNLKEFESVFYENEERLHITDDRGWGVFHFAATTGQTTIMDFCKSNGANINLASTECHGTALHGAIHADQADAIDWLVIHGIDTSIKNTWNDAAIHLCVRLDKPKMLKVLLRHADVVDTKLGGDYGRTALHYAAHLHRLDCAKVLVEMKAAWMCQRCKYGYYPVHAATMAKAADVLDYLLSNALPPEYAPSMVMNYKDKDCNMPLHTAINTGDIETVKVCLKHGACILQQQDDKSTPVHLACANGCVDMLAVMFAQRPDALQCVLAVRDVQQRTPLHIAAMYDRPDVVKFLFEKGANLNVQDYSRRTPILLAANNRSWKAVKMLFELGADAMLTDDEQRNILHLSIMHGANVENFPIKHEAKSLLFNARDVHGCAPLHYATKEGHLVSLTSLIGWGANLCIVNHDQQNPLHFAAKFVTYGRYHTCKRLLDSAEGKSILNEVDKLARSALHFAAGNGHWKVVQLLIQRGINPAKDLDQNTPIHCAAMNGYTKTLKTLLHAHMHLLNAQNIDGDTALHLAAKNDEASTIQLLLSYGCELLLNSDGESYMGIIINSSYEASALAVIAHERWKEALSVRVTNHCVPIVGFIRQMPIACTAVLDRSYTSKGTPRSADFEERYDFSFLEASFEKVLEYREQGVAVPPLAALNLMVQHDRVELLSHHVVETFLQVKWRDYGWFVFMANLLLYASFLFCLTFPIVFGEIKPLSHIRNESELAKSRFAVGSAFARQSGFTVDEERFLHFNDAPAKITTHTMVFLYGIVIFSISNLIKECVQLYQQRLKYFTGVANYIEWVLYGTSCVFAFPFLFGYDSHVQWQCATVACLLAWFNLMLYLQRTATMGIYVVMFLEILRTLLKVIFIFCNIIIGFGLAYHIIFSEQSGYHSAGISIVTSVLMMLGEINFADRWVKPYVLKNDVLLHYPGLSIAVLLVFSLLVPILLMNLLIGLAVGDIGAIQRNAKLKRLAMQVELHTDIEGRLPDGIKKKIIREIFVRKPNVTGVQKFFAMMNAIGRSSAGDEEMNENIKLAYEIQSAISQQKQRLKKMETRLEKQHDLLKLILQKMEIRSEDDEYDEGVSTDDVAMMEKCNKVTKKQDNREAAARRIGSAVSQRSGSKI